MCLIVVKSRKLQFPPVDTLATAWKNNPDGFGLAWSDGRRVHIRKGAMTLEQALELIATVPEPQQHDVVMHFRLATAGRIDAGNTHPFPISSSVTRLRQLNLDCNMALAHNGHILSAIDYNTWDYYGEYESMVAVPSFKARKLTDTQEFIQTHLAGLPPKILTNEKVLALIREATYSKFALLTPIKTYLIGEFREDKGILYSNSGYKELQKYATCHQFQDDKLSSYPPESYDGAMLKEGVQKKDIWQCEYCGDYTDEQKYAWYGLTICSFCRRSIGGNYQEEVDIDV